MRTILHSDLNNFYASVECVYEPSLRAVPMAVCGDPAVRHGIVLAKNMLAKRAGVQTGEAVWQAVRKCPNLKIIPPDYPKYLRFARMMKAICAEYTDAVESFGLDECWMDVTGHERGGEAIAGELRRRAREELGLTVSVGVSYNKIFAKLGSDMKKPDATTVITPENYRDRVWPLPAGDLLYVGPSTRRRLAARNIRTIGDIARSPRELLRTALGKSGEMLWVFANGLDQSPVLREGEGEAIKSVGNSTTTARDIVDDAGAHRVLMALADSVAERLRAQGLQGRTVCVSVRDCALYTTSVRHRLDHATALASEICTCAMALFRAHYRWERPVRSLGVSVSALESLEGDVQLSLFADSRDRRYDLENAVGDIRRRFGHDALRRASLLGGGEIHFLKEN